LPGSIILWLRRDLRLHDNPALCRACSEAGRVIPVYIHAPEDEAPWQPGAASRWWLHHSLQALDNDLAALQSRLVIRRGEPLSMLMMLCEQAGAGAVYWNRLYEPAAVARDQRVKAALRSTGIAARSFPGYLLREPWEVATGGGTPYKVFTPYSRANLRLGEPPAPSALHAGEPLHHDTSGESLESLALLPRIRWDAGLHDTWRPGEAAAWRRLAAFIEGHAASYDDSRNRPDTDGVSRLSPHLHFGEISPRALWHAVVNGLGAAGRESSAHAYLRQLLWRDFAHHLLFHFPSIPEENFKPAFDAYPWRGDPALEAAWQRGVTGIPLVDAGMRELWHTGFMHNRARMSTASFLTKNAGVHWRAGARWFWDTLVDANLANNTLGWQWVAGSGPDAAPYFRIFNPVTQGLRFDPQGRYVRRWIPEIADLPDKHIHAPWGAPGAVLSGAGVELGRDYPSPLIDLKQSRQRALAHYRRYVKAG